MKRDSVSKNYLYNLTYQILGLVTPLITTPYVSRTLNANLIGDYNFTNSITQYFILFAAIGVSLYAQREVAYARDNIKKRSIIFYEIQIFKLITFSISGILYIFTMCRNEHYGLLYQIQLLYIFGAFIDISWLFQGLELFKFTVIRNIIIKVLGIILIFLCVKDTNDLDLYILILCATNVLGNLTLWPYLPKYLQRVEWSKLNPLSHLKPTIALFIPQLASQIYMVFDWTMLGLLSNTSEVGYYTQAEKIVKMSLTVLTSLGTVLMPRVASNLVSKNYKEVERNFNSSITSVIELAIPMTVGMAFISPSFIPWFLGNGYDRAIGVMEILSPLAIIMGIAGITGPAFLIPLNLVKEYTISVLSGAFINVFLNLILIKTYGAYGTAIATICAEAVVTLIQIIAVRKFISIGTLFTSLIKYAMLTLPMLTFLLITSNIGFFSGFLLIIRCILSILIYLVTLLIAKDKLAITIIGRLKKVV
jgi:O-antigen/teichoic acid export membrane protein